MLAAMKIHSRWLALLGVLVAARMALADPTATEKTKQPAKQETAATDSGGRTPSERKALMRQLRDEREKMVRERGEIGRARSQSAVPAPAKVIESRRPEASSVRCRRLPSRTTAEVVEVVAQIELDGFNTIGAVVFCVGSCRRIA
jgi:hypothetical protein